MNRILITATLKYIAITLFLYIPQTAVPNPNEKHLSFLKNHLHRNGNLKNISTSRLCSLETCRENRYSYIHTFCPDISECRKIVCSKDLSRLHPIEETTYNWMTHTRQQKRYKIPFREVKSRDIFRHFTRGKPFHGTLLVEEYLKGIPMWWKLQSVEELKLIVIYFAAQTTINNILPRKNTLLLISIEDNLLTNPLANDETTLNENEIEILETYFQIVDDEKTITNYHTFYRAMMLQLSKIEALNYPVVTDSFASNVINTVEHHCRSIGFKEIALGILAFKTLQIIRKIEPVIDNICKAGIQGVIDKIQEMIDGKDSDNKDYDSSSESDDETQRKKMAARIRRRRHAQRRKGSYLNSHKRPTEYLRRKHRTNQTGGLRYLHKQSNSEDSSSE